MDADHVVGDVYNVGSQEEISIGDLARLIIERTGSASAISHMAFEDAYDKDFEDMPRRIPSIAKIEAAIGWTPEHDLEQILADVIAERVSGGRGIAAVA
jgi:UDP-glucose 4-epimerase